MIYCLEDDKNIQDLVVYALQTSGFEAKGFSNSEGFYKELEAAKPTLIVLDIMLPGEDGISILKRLKNRTDTKKIPVIMLTAKGAEYDKVQGLDLGADDYVSKPFSVMELISRVKAVLRRTAPKTEEKELTVGNLCLNLEKHLVHVNGREVNLTFKEFELLHYLMENEGIVLTRDKLLERIWGFDFDGETRTIDVHVGTLRHKLGEFGSAIETVRGLGYRIGGKT